MPVARGRVVAPDAAISPGSSGGGLFNANGELVGITTFKRRGENLNFALPADWVRELRERGRSEVEMAKLRAACAEDPDFDCLVALALRDAESIEDGLLRDYSLKNVAQALINIATAQAKAGERQAARKTFAAALKIAQKSTRRCGVHGH